MKVKNLLENEIRNPLKNPYNMDDYYPIFSEVEDLFTEKMYKPGQAPNYAQILQDFRDLGKIQKVNIKELIPIENKVDLDFIKVIQSGKKHLQSSKYPLIYVVNGNKPFILDGNHRVVAAYLSGHKTIKALVLDLDHITKLLNS